MDEATTKLMNDKAAAASKETAEALKRFAPEVIMMMYAKHMQENEKHGSIPKSENPKMAKMIEEGQLKWKYADEAAKKKVAQMEKIISDGQEKIKAIYAANT